MRIVAMPMAGLGVRFSELHPDKKLTPIPPNNEPMFIHAILHLGFSYDKILLIPQEKESIEAALSHYPSIAEKAIVVPTGGLTRGPLDTVLRAQSILADDPTAELLICNCDQVLVWPGEWALSWLKERGAIGGIPTMERQSHRHSYAAIDEHYAGRVTRVREKERISNRATLGVYWFREIASFLRAAQSVVENNDVAPNGELYVSHVYNYLEGLTLEYPLCESWSLGEPENYESYLAKNYRLGKDA